MQWNVIFKMFITKTKQQQKCTSRILYPAKLTFKNEGKINTYLNFF